MRKISELNVEQLYVSFNSKYDDIDEVTWEKVNNSVKMALIMDYGNEFMETIDLKIIELRKLRRK